MSWTLPEDRRRRCLPRTRPGASFGATHRRREGDDIMDGIKRHLTTIVVAFVTATVAAGGTAAVAAVINANKLNGYAANQLIRVSSKRITSAINPTTRATLGSSSIKAPKKGYLVIDASSAIDDGLGVNDAVVSCWL